jgi:K+-transporting ATPase KdpF subunit
MSGDCKVLPLCSFSRDFSPTFSFTPTPMFSTSKTSVISRTILLTTLCNLAIAPPIYAAGNGAIDRGTAYALGLLVIIVLGLAVYLAMVIIEPERF